MNPIEIAIDLGQHQDIGPGIFPFLKSVETGSTLDIRTPLFDQRPRREVVDEWTAILDRHELPGRLAQIEDDQRRKIGSLSIRDPLRERVPLVRDYWTRPIYGVADINLDAYDLPTAIKRMRPLAHENAALELAGNTNSGYPHFTKRWRVRPEAVKMAKGIKPLLADRLLPAILGWRGQSLGLDQELSSKQRTVWMYSYPVNIQEMRFFRPMQAWLLKWLSGLSAWRTPEHVDKAVHEAINFAQRMGTVIISTDFSSYDQSLGYAHTLLAYQLMGSLFQKGYTGEIDMLWEYMHSVPLIISSDRMWKGDHGVSSGSVFTNLVDTIVHMAAASWAVSEAGARLSTNLSQFQGDDGLLVTFDSAPIEKITEAYAELGIEANYEKQFLGLSDALFLQRYYTKDWSDGRVGIYPTYRALNSLLGQERFYDADKWDARMVVLRAIMILENTKHHPAYLDFVRFVADGDSLRLGANYPGGIDALLFSGDVIQRANDIAGFIPSYNQEKRIGGIVNFRTYHTIKGELQ
jgi:hypothetical protein